MKLSEFKRAIDRAEEEVANIMNSGDIPKTPILLFVYKDNKELKLSSYTTSETLVFDLDLVKYSEVNDIVTVSESITIREILKRDRFSDIQLQQWFDSSI